MLLPGEGPAVVTHLPGGVHVTVARTWSVGLTGMYGAMVEIEVDIGQGVPGVTLVGLPDAVVRQSVDRVKAAIANVGGTFPYRKSHDQPVPGVHAQAGQRLRPRHRRRGAGASGAVALDALDDVVLLGELGLDGALRGIRGVLPAVLEAARAGHRQMVVPGENADEAALVDRHRGASRQPVCATSSRTCAGRDCCPPHRRGAARASRRGPDLADVVGQASGRRARSRSPPPAAHHLYLAGPPGAGKTMLAERLPGRSCRRWTSAAALEVTAIHSIAGTLPPRRRC